MGDLYLTVKRSRFNELKAGLDNIEYREVKEYWAKRLYKKCSEINNGNEWRIDNEEPKEYNRVIVSNGNNCLIYKYKGFKVSLKGGTSLMFAIDLSERL